MEAHGDEGAEGPVGLHRAKLTDGSAVASASITLTVLDSNTPPVLSNVPVEVNRHRLPAGVPPPPRRDQSLLEPRHARDALGEQPSEPRQIQLSLGLVQIEQ